MSVEAETGIIYKATLLKKLHAEGNTSQTLPIQRQSILHNLQSLIQLYFNNNGVGPSAANKFKVPQLSPQALDLRKQVIDTLVNLMKDEKGVGWSMRSKIAECLWKCCENGSKELFSVMDICEEVVKNSRTRQPRL